MTGRQKIATVSGLIGALAVLYGGAAPAFADDSKGVCTITQQGDIVCVKKTEVVHKDKRDGYVLQQKQDCSTTERPRFVGVDGRAVDEGATDSGPVVECNNRAELPKGFKLPKFDF
ncbi:MULTISPECIES: hypothetical protein [unclassified Streptomyces]|uniref:hypothetical protein n=1 Tax=unclassified Streptomyces TaxID=2593676 RepID=UPI0024B7ACC3|nr:hypothetical protein [Streptomyces sp. KAU_LT]MDI9835880.1 hypothetical protein [Streptomyces sp. KAU_LT]